MCVCVSLRSLLVMLCHTNWLTIRLTGLLFRNSFHEFGKWSWSQVLHSGLISMYLSKPHPRTNHSQRLAQFPTSKRDPPMSQTSLISAGWMCELFAVFFCPFGALAQQIISWARGGGGMVVVVVIVV